jgi:hypothetical protein
MASSRRSIRSVATSQVQLLRPWVVDREVVMLMSRMEAALNSIA